MKSPTRDIVLSCRQLAVGYGKKIILQDLDLEIQKGELIAFIGPNGVGKSTLIRTLCGIQPALDGSVWLMGQNIELLSKHEVALSLSLVLTDKIDAGNLTVRELVTLGRYPRTNWRGTLSKEDHQKVEKAIDDTRINYISERTLHELSDGQIQKAMIARALAQDGDLIVLDEPTAHLDINNRVEILRLLKDLSRESNKAILLSTHDLDLAMQVADLIWLANWNQPLATGAPEDIILSGSLIDTFISDSFEFDQTTGRFLFKNRNNGNVNIVGEGLRAYWTIQAFKRKGIHQDESSAIKVLVKENEWEIHSNNQTKSYSTIKSLLDHF